MQNVEHIVLGVPPEAASTSSASLNGCWVTGGHYFVATRMRPALSVHLHLLMLEHVLTNVEHDAQWEISVRICAFWLDLTSGECFGRLHGKSSQAYSSTPAERCPNICALSPHAQREFSLRLDGYSLPRVHDCFV
jgi:hypothetical protein